MRLSFGGGGVLLARVRTGTRKPAKKSSTAITSGCQAHAMSREGDHAAMLCAMAAQRRVARRRDGHTGGWAHVGAR